MQQRHDRTLVYRGKTEVRHINVFVNVISVTE